MHFAIKITLLVLLGPWRRHHLPAGRVSPCSAGLPQPYLNPEGKTRVTVMLDRWLMAGFDVHLASMLQPSFYIRLINATAAVKIRQSG